ncbi:MAG: hypothetical protein GWN07_23425 [Actinobacteria bacterium]|nr:hypothetical protein [Actinomycetota bacterium]NIU68370.1 hypothetical protein [Actinomycetota bacterium]NIW30194.1 hypothetical protein [Actinomycetota bacterium]NIX22613.1 hypothetical protein [Actinomycetota bacterium]
MGWHRTGVILLVALGCSSTVEDSREALPIDETNDREGALDPNGLFDAEGRLRPSDTKVVGLTLPRGLTPLEIEREREHHYIAPDVEVDALIAYLGPRLVTGAVDRVGAGATFRDAVPREVDEGAVRLDVSAHPSRRGGSRLTIVELPASHVNLEPGELDPARVRTAQQALRNLE